MVYFVLNRGIFFDTALKIRKKALLQGKIRLFYGINIQKILSKTINPQ